MISFDTRAEEEEEWVGELKNEGKVAEQDEGEQKREEEVGHENVDTSENSSEAGVYINSTADHVEIRATRKVEVEKPIEN